MSEGAIVDTVTPHLAEMTAKLSDLTVPITAIGQAWMRDAAINIGAAKGALYGPAWPPMAASTVRKGRNPATLLVDTGALLDAASGGPGAFSSVTPMSGEFAIEPIGKRGAYAGFQNFGTSKIPARDFGDPVYPQQLEEYAGIMQEFVTTGITA